MNGTGSDSAFDQRQRLEDDVISWVDTMSELDRAREYVRLHEQGLDIFHALRKMSSRSATDDATKDALVYWALHRRHGLTLSAAQHRIQTATGGTP